MAPGHLARIAALVVAAIGLILWASPPTALVAGILFALLIGHPFAHWNHKVTKWLLQICVVLLGFGMNLPMVLRLGLNGSLFAAATISVTLALGTGLPKPSLAVTVTSVAVLVPVEHETLQAVIGVGTAVTVD